MKLFSRFAVIVVALALGHAPSARADEAADQFKVHVQRAKVHYDLGEYDEAADEYIQGYRIKPVAGALFNTAQAYRQAGKYAKAQQFYRSYLREASPEALASTKPVVEKAIKELDELIAKEEKAKKSAPNGVQPSLVPGNEDGSADLSPAPTKKAKPDELAPPMVVVAAPAPVPAPIAANAKPAPAPVPAPAAPAPTKLAIAQPQHPPPAAPAPTPAVTTKQPATVARADAQSKEGPSHTLAYVVGGAGIVLLGGGALFTVKAMGADSDLTGTTIRSRADDDSLVSTSKTDHLLGAIFLGAGAVAVVGAGLLYFIPTSGPSGGSGAAVGGHF